MWHNEEIFSRHPQLLKLREFKTDEEIVQRLKREGGTTLWYVWSDCGEPRGVSFHKVRGVGTFKKEGLFFGNAVYYHGGEDHHHEFISSLQCIPAKAVFTSQEAAEAYLAAAKDAFANDPEWQADVEQEKDEIDELCKIVDAVLPM